jgi:hypothetical protein
MLHFNWRLVREDFALAQVLARAFSCIVTALKLDDGL